MTKPDDITYTYTFCNLDHIVSNIHVILCHQIIIEVPHVCIVDLHAMIYMSTWYNIQ